MRRSRKTPHQTQVCKLEVEGKGKKRVGLLFQSRSVSLTGHFRGIEVFTKVLYEISPGKRIL